MTVRVLYFDPAPYPGGSIISLTHLVKGLDRTWEPLVVLSHANPYQGFDEAGIPTQRVWVPQWDRLAKRRAVVTLNQAAGPSGGRSLRSWMQQGRIRGGIWHAGGQVRRWQRDIWPVARQLRQIIRTFRPHLIHLNEVVSVVPHGLLAARLTGTPTINHNRSFVYPSPGEQRWLMPALKGMIFISQAMADAHLQHLRHPLPYRVIPNAVDLRLFQSPAPREVMRAGWGVPTDAWVVGMAGRIEPWKGQHVFVEAFAQLARDHAHVYGLLVGDADTPTGQGYKQQLLARIRDLGLEGRLLWLGHREDMPDVLAAVDVLVHASVEPEPFGRVIIEGMAAGKPVIASAAGGVLEIIRDGVDGLLVPPGDVPALLRALTWLFTHPDAAQTMGQRARATVAQRYTIDRHVEAVTAFYRDVLQL